MQNNAVESVAREEKISRAMTGNTNAQPARIVSDMLRRLAIQNPHKLRLACEGMLDRAATDVQAFNAIADRIEGKVALQIQSSTTHTLIDANLLSEAGKLLQLISGQIIGDADIPTPCEIVDPEASEEVENSE